jgi:hypothetical protein
MGKILMLLGVMVVIASIAGMVYGFAAGTMGWTDEIQDAVSGEGAAELCTEGEKLVEQSGSSRYTPGVGYGRSVLYFCEDAQGNRRDINSEYFGNMFGDITGTVFGSIGQFGVGIIASFGIGLGIILIVIGSIMNRFRRRADGINPYLGGTGFNVTTGLPQVSVQRMDLNSDFAPFIPGQSAPVGSANAGAANNANLTDRLRQLEQARRENLISQAEYDRMRKEILDQMR